MLIFHALLPPPTSTEFCLHMKNHWKVPVSQLSQNSGQYIQRVHNVLKTVPCMETAPDLRKQKHVCTLWSQDVLKIHTHKNTSLTWAEEAAQSVKDLPCKQEDMRSIPRMHMMGRGLDTVAHSSNPSTGEEHRRIPGAQ